MSEENSEKASWILKGLSTSRLLHSGCTRSIPKIQHNLPGELVSMRLMRPLQKEVITKLVNLGTKNS